jgi:hypothetical protein
LLGLANYYHNFIQEFIFFPKVATTLPDFLGKNWLSQEWDEFCHQAFGELKSKLFSPPVFKFAELDKSFEMYTGVSDFAIDALLMHIEWPLFMRACSSRVVKGDNQLMRNESSP